MRTIQEIKERLNELTQVQKTANYHLEKSIKENNQREVIYWERTVAEFKSQCYALRFCIGECE